MLVTRNGTNIEKSKNDEYIPSMNIQNESSCGTTRGILEINNRGKVRIWQESSESANIRGQISYFLE